MRRGAAAAPLVVRAVADVEVVEVVGRGEHVGDTGRRVVGSSRQGSAVAASVSDHEERRTESEWRQQFRFVLSSELLYSA
ncbi:hypothetical protein JOF35_008282 [Streptomyces demainii]|uniref:Uncharacterized protein n=1 Tax=Streptomyces demainii TaxID=588122 RepID=A0ABT9L5G7_9ACTN|nr:hypothetical protein [Streptomyces demainii]